MAYTLDHMVHLMEKIHLHDTKPEGITNMYIPDFKVKANVILVLDHLVPIDELLFCLPTHV